MKSSLAILPAVVLFFAGCNYNMPREPVVPENTNTAVQKSQAQIDEENRILTEDPLILAGTSEYQTIPCSGREIEITDDSTAYTAKLTGECKKVTVAGVSNKVTVDKVGEIVVSGSSNRVIYGEGLDGKKPKITKTGISTSVETLEAVEKKKAAKNKQQ